MKQSILEHYANHYYRYSEVDQILSIICIHAAATIHHYKPASLICFKNGNMNLKDLWDKHQFQLQELIPFQWKELKRCDKGVHILFYWEDWLIRIIRNKHNSRFLSSLGYQEDDTLDAALSQLSHRFENGCPHEIGIFLGYPLSDVIAFSADPKKECLCVKYWKVYSNVNQAQKIFHLYDQARNIVLQSFEKGVTPQVFVQSMLTAS